MRSPVRFLDLGSHCRKQAMTWYMLFFLRLRFSFRFFTVKSFSPALTIALILGPFQHGTWATGIATNTSCFRLSIGNRYGVRLVSNIFFGVFLVVGSAITAAVFCGLPDIRDSGIHIAQVHAVQVAAFSVAPSTVLVYLLSDSATNLASEGQVLFVALMQVCALVVPLVVSYFCFLFKPVNLFEEASCGAVSLLFRFT